MAPRKDQMRIIRQDAGFSAKLGFGTAGGEGPVAETPAPPSPKVPPATIDSAEVMPQGDDGGRPGRIREEARKEEGEPPAAVTPPIHSAASAQPPAARGQVVYVAVSLTPRQAARAEVWAAAARCPVRFLIRRVAQALRDQVFDDWARDGMPEVTEPRGVRGKHPTSVTLTLRQQFATDLAARHDPLGLMGLARVMGPAYRARFHEAFDVALEKAERQMKPGGKAE
ncbi:hypothetical protein D2N39_18275 [Gemmobacter lutimaris]|uniref:Uncharacterized protein n=1 Tax=Gemmobacter lutimaris TaxID=2306023 RepID=A0A398BKW2_9RHOB|nr:hypothetical protein [Gemmobacter lutimaris]RID90314.1 hypothetical protein D2N39_18275 [Gemmobacter lutimaris]